MNPRDRQILHIAIPSIVSNITVPLLGLVDVAITGHLGAAAYIAVQYHLLAVRLSADGQQRTHLTGAGKA